MSDEVDFLHADKYQSFLQVDFNTVNVSHKAMLWFLMEMFKHSQSSQNKFAMSLSYLKKQVNEVDSCACR